MCVSKLPEKYPKRTGCCGFCLNYLKKRLKTLEIKVFLVFFSSSNTNFVMLPEF